jgi:protein-tyrosine phosphatase
LPTEDDGETQWGGIVRADNLRRLTPDGWQALLDHGILAAVDLRRPDELALDASRHCPIDVVNVNLCPLDGVTAVLDADIRIAYLDMLDRFSDNFAQAIRAVARAPEGGVVVHCLVGRDRTGLVSALLLRLAGVDIGTVAADWVESDANLEADLEAWVAAASDPDERERRRGWVAGVSSAFMEDVLTELDERHGGAAGYLRAAGVGDADLELTRARLRG